MRWVQSLLRSEEGCANTLPIHKVVLEMYYNLYILNLLKIAYFQAGVLKFSENFKDI